MSYEKDYLERAVNLDHAKRFTRKLHRYNRALGNKGNPDLSPKPLTKYQKYLRYLKDRINRRIS